MRQREARYEERDGVTVFLLEKLRCRCGLGKMDVQNRPMRSMIIVAFFFSLFCFYLFLSHYRFQVLSRTLWDLVESHIFPHKEHLKIWLCPFFAFSKEQ